MSGMYINGDQSANRKALDDSLNGVIECEDFHEVTDNHLHVRGLAAKGCIRSSFATEAVALLEMERKNEKV